jgi:hypothetical protein
MPMSRATRQRDAQVLRNGTQAFGTPPTSGVTHPRGGQLYCSSSSEDGAAADQRLRRGGVRFGQTRSRAAAGHAAEVQQRHPRAAAAQAHRA